MKKVMLRFAVALTFLLCLFSAFCLTGSARQYEPDGTSSVITSCETPDWNRTIYVRMQDEAGNHLKTVEIRTTRGKDTMDLIHLYNYDIVSFSSDQGLWETCKLGWESGGDFYGSDIWIKYYFRTGMSQEALHVTVVMRPIQEIKVMQMHYLEVREGNNGVIRGELLEEYSETVLHCGDYYWSHANQYVGYTLNDKYEESVIGNWSMSWIGQSKNLDELYMEWDIVDDHPNIKDSYEDFSYYSESEHGNLSYAVNRRVKLRYIYEVDWCVCKFDANGGEGAPEEIGWWYHHDIVIPATVPTKDGYIFLGWGAQPDSTDVLCSPGEKIKMELNPILYAVWEKYDYDLSVSDITVIPEGSNDELTVGSYADVRVTAQNSDRNDAYYNIFVDFYYDGELKSSTYSVHLKPLEQAYVTFRFFLGYLSGDHEIEIRINWELRDREINADNNVVKKTIHVKSDDYGFSVKNLENADPYRAGMDVVSSFLISNSSERAVLPNANATADCFVYLETEDNSKVLLLKKTVTGIVIPNGESNLLYFQWHVPEDAVGKTVTCECTVNPTGALKENNRRDNTASFTKTVTTQAESQTTDPSYAENAPDGFVKEDAPAKNLGSVTWSVWAYEDGMFVKKTYGIRVSPTEPTVTPGKACETATFVNGILTVRSGYGIGIAYTPTVETLNGYLTPEEEMYTSAQSVTVTFPEYGYSEESGEYRTLIFADGAWRFVENPSADGNERIHYIPVWFEDGGYTLAVTVSDVWTPVGMIRATRCVTVHIDGSVFDDFYVG